MPSLEAPKSATWLYYYLNGGASDDEIQENMNLITQPHSKLRILIKLSDKIIVGLKQIFS